MPTLSNFQACRRSQSWRSRVAFDDLVARDARGFNIATHAAQRAQVQCFGTCGLWTLKLALALARTNVGANHLNVIASNCCLRHSQHTAVSVSLLRKLQFSAEQKLA